MLDRRQLMSGIAALAFIAGGVSAVGAADPIRVGVLVGTSGAGAQIGNWTNRGVEIAGVLQIESQIDMDFGNVRLRLNATAIGLNRAWRVAQIFADQSKREPSAPIALSKR